jgi:dipeptidyl aminopeptidase/acylaminoacyl peptidase
VLDLASRSLKQTTSGNGRISQIEWQPDGTHLVATVTARPESDQWNEQFVSIDIASGRSAELSRPRGPVGTFAVSPDGRAIVYQGARIDGPDAHDLWLEPLEGGSATNLTGASLDRPVSLPRWADAKTILATTQRGFASAIVSVSTAGGARIIDGIALNPSAFDRSSNGTIAYVGETATQAPEVWIKPPSAPARKVTSLNEKWSAIKLIQPTFVTFKSFDGLEIEAALLEPSAANRRPTPTIILVHGGPTGRWADTFEPWGQLLVARGYAVLYPNVRGSTGYGEKFVEANRADWGGGDFKDVMAAADWAVARGIADPSRIGIGGWSYGGYMAAWAVTQTSRFKAAVSGAPVIDMASEFGTEDGSAYDEWFYGTPYERLEGFIKSSPITHVKNARTPTLLLQGENDVTDPIGQSQQFYRGLKRYGVETDLVLYPREGHGLREEKHLIDRLARILAWYDRYLKPTS